MSRKFNAGDIVNMKVGLAPQAHPDQCNKKLTSYQLHHNNPVYNGGKLYDFDNINIVTPKFHKEILESKFHYDRE